MRRDNTSDLKWDDLRAHEQASAQHAVWHGLSWDAEEVEVRLLTTLILHSRVAERHDQTVQKERHSGEVRVEGLGKS